jgi:alpha-glucoside transport system permease protein
VAEDNGPGRAATGGRAAAPEAPPAAEPRPGRAPGDPRKARRRRQWFIAGVFLAPALVLLGFLVVYPIFYTVYRSMFDQAGNTFVAADNYAEVFTSGRMLTALRNNAIWVGVVPPVVTGLGLTFAVLTERIRWATAFKVAIFMPLAISFLSAGVMWKLMYERNPERGFLNAGVQGAVGLVSRPGDYTGARPSEENLLQPRGQAMESASEFSPGDTAQLGLVAISPDMVPDAAQPASAPQPASGAIAGLVWLDFAPGGGGEKGQPDQSERGLPGVRVQAVSDGQAVATAITEDDGTFVLEDLGPGSYVLRLPKENFRPPFGGVAWLGPTLVTPAVIGAYVWIYVGFAMVIIGAGLAAIPRDVLEAARVDGATEWQVFRRVTVPLLAPVLGVVFVTLMISALKVFDLVLVIPPLSTQVDANVLALEMWRQSFGGGRNHGLGSALAVLLFVLVVPAMALNVRRFRSEG